VITGEKAQEILLKWEPLFQHSLKDIHFVSINDHHFLVWVKPLLGHLCRGAASPSQCVSDLVGDIISSEIDGRGIDPAIAI